MGRCLWMALALTWSACAGTPPDPVASVAVELERDEVVLGGVLRMGYRFGMAEGQSPLTKNHRVFVHFVDADGDVMWTDDHDPPEPTSTWRQGQLISYERTVFLPPYPYIGTATIRVGLYPPNGAERLPLIGEDDGARSYKVGTLELLPQSEDVFLRFVNGWHEPEVMPGNPGVRWRWTQAEAMVAFRNPHRDVRLHLRVDGRPDLVGGPQGVVLKIADREVAEFSLETSEVELKQISITQAQLGDEDMIELLIVVDGSFVPAEGAVGGTTDTRELGIRVFNMIIDANG